MIVLPKTSPRSQVLESGSIHCLQWEVRGQHWPLMSSLGLGLPNLPPGLGPVLGPLQWGRVCVAMPWSWPLLPLQVQQYRVAMTAKDCSIMIALSPCLQDARWGTCYCVMCPWSSRVLWIGKRVGVPIFREALAGSCLLTEANFQGLLDIMGIINSCSLEVCNTVKKTLLRIILKACSFKFTIIF